MDKKFDFDDCKTFPSKGKSSGYNAFYTTFQCDKPYRLAFYVQPNIKRRLIINRSVNNTTSNVDTTKANNTSSSMSTTQNTTMNKTEEIAKPATKRGNPRKRVNNNKENEGKNKSKITKKNETTALFETENTSMSQMRQSGRLRELNFKKSVNTTTEKEAESSKDETIEVKKKRYSATYAKKPKEPAKPKEPTRTKQKEPARTKQKETTKQKKPDPDFEKWAEDINKEFDEVEHFNISVSYD